MLITYFNFMYASPMALFKLVFMQILFDFLHHPSTNSSTFGWYHEIVQWLITIYSHKFWN
jgi:hypothetical protein